jgi:hypothetical protein
MSSLANNVILFIFVIVFIVIFQLIANFFSISYGDYSTYMFWIIALIIFYYILPSNYTLF